MSKPKKKTSGCAWIFLLLILFGCLTFFSTDFDSPPPKPKEYKPIDYAMTMSWEFVRKELKAPSSAKFGRIAEHYVGPVEGFENRFRVQGPVTSLNSFGVQATDTFDCILEYKGDEKWSLIELNWIQ